MKIKFERIIRLNIDNLNTYSDYFFNRSSYNEQGWIVHDNMASVMGIIQHVKTRLFWHLRTKYS